VPTTAPPTIAPPPEPAKAQQPPHEDEELAHNKRFFSSTVKVFIGLSLPMLLGAAGTYCMIQGKVVDDITALFYAGAAMLAIAAVAMIIACMYFSKHPPSPDSCFAALFAINVCTSCCGAAADVAETINNS
jgi:hypothetical protein